MYRLARFFTIRTDQPLSMLCKVLALICMVGIASSHQPAAAFAASDFETSPTDTDTDTDTDTEPIKCLTPWILLYGEDASRLEPHIRNKIEELLPFDAQSAESHLSPSGRFRLVFHRDGFHAVPADDESGSGLPDYIERAAQYADFSWQRQVADIGFKDPVGDTPLTIEFRNIGSQTYGYTIRDSGATRIVVHNTFRNFPPNDDPDGNQFGALKVTIAHEFKHAIQFATNRWQGDAGSTDWVEMDATMMENVVYPQVNDYYNYIQGTSGIFGNPGRSTPVAYSHVTWSLFFAEHSGMSYWVDVWNHVRGEPLLPMIRAMQQAITADPESGIRRFRELVTRNHLWHATSGSRSVAGYGFAESDAYPDAVMEIVDGPVPEWYVESGEQVALSGSYRMFYPGPGQIGQISVTVTHDQNQLGIGVLAYQRDGSVREWIPMTGTGASTHAASPFSVAQSDSFLLVVTNADPADPVSFQLEMTIESIPDVVVLEQNYPNPFSESVGNPGTSIPFSIPGRERVVLSVHDVTGRKVVRLFDQELEPGRYSVPFNAKGLSSGVYIYRLQAGSIRKTGTMTYLR
ncbi:MAG: MXAN_6640 family putative metalloprotease [Bacteroidota bacterium]